MIEVGGVCVRCDSYNSAAIFFLWVASLAFTFVIVRASENSWKARLKILSFYILASKQIVPPGVGNVIK